MTRRLMKMYTQLRAKPYRVALRYFETSKPKEVIEVYRFFSYGDLASGLLNTLAAEDPAFLGKVSQIDDKRFMASRHKTRRYVADNREHLYMNSPHLEKHSRKVQDHWVVTNIGQVEAQAIASTAAAAAGVTRLRLSELQF